MLWDIEATRLEADWGFMLCVGYKYLGDKKPKVLSIIDYEGHSRDCMNDKRLLKACAPILNEAGAWVTWYGKRYDEPFVNSRLIHHGLHPLANVPHIDCWETARKRLHLQSNRLANVQDFLGLDAKTPLLKEQWRRAAIGHRPSIKYIEQHCAQDVDTLEQAYLRLLPLIRQHPHKALMDDRPDGCPRCGAPRDKLQQRGSMITLARKWLRYQCVACGGWTKGDYEKGKKVAFV